MTYFWQNPAVALKHSGESPAEFSERVQNKYGLVNFWVYQDQQGHLRLDAIEVPRGERGRGVGSRAMEELVDYADQRRQLVHLTPASHDPHHGTTSRNRLIRFYKRFGFVENRGRRHDYTLRSGDMYRVPRK